MGGILRKRALPMMDFANILLSAIPITSSDRIPGKRDRIAVAVFLADHFPLYGDSGLFEVCDPGGQPHNAVFLHCFQTGNAPVVLHVSEDRFTLCHIRYLTDQPGECRS